MRGLSTLATVLRPYNAAAHALQEPILPAAQQPKVLQLCFDSVLARLQAHDIDQEIKDGAIAAAGTLLGHLGDSAQGKAAQGTVLRLLGERLKGENTRVPALRAIGYIASSPLKLDIAAPVSALLPELSGFLRQNTRALRAQTLATLSAVVSAYAASLDAAALKVVVAEASSPSLLSDSDLHLCHLAIAFLTTIVSTLPAPAAASLVTEDVLRRLLELAVSQVMQGAALNSLVAFFRACVKQNLDSKLFGPDALISSIVGQAASRSVARQALVTAARCIAGVQLAAPAPTGPKAVLSSLEAALASPEATSSTSVYLARLTVAESSRQCDILALQPTAASSLIAILKAAASASASGASSSGSAAALTAVTAIASDDLRVAAAMALGGIVAFAMPAGLPQLTAAISAAASSSMTETYSLLQALREAIVRHAPSTPEGPSIAAYGEAILSLLCSAPLVGASEEGVRGIVAECLGRLAGVQHDHVLAALVSTAQSSTNTARWTAVTAARHAVSLLPLVPSLHAPLKAALPALLRTLVDDDLKQRAAALLTVSVILHSEPQLLIEALLKVPAGRFLPPGINVPGAEAAATRAAPAAADLAREGVLAVIYYECIPRPELIKEVDLGPFKHKIDEGLPVRRVAFTALDSALTNTVQLVGPEAVPVLCSGARDAEDVRLLAHALIGRVAASGWLRSNVESPEVLEMVIDAIDTSIKLPSADAGGSGGAPGAASSGSSVASAVDVTRSAMRALEAVLRCVPGAASLRRTAEVMAKIERSELAPVFAAIRADAASASSAARS
jgi:cullin-associated NEDD8-dissociated protein 1